MLFQLPRDLLLPTLISYTVTLLIAFTIHEFAHAWTANELGDRTAAYQGRLTLNPLAHLDPFGALALYLVGFGWAKPVPVNPYNLRNGKMGSVMVSAAGPLSNLLMALLAAIPIRFGLIHLDPYNTNALVKGVLPSLGYLGYVFITTNILLMVFNLIPIAPLDGFRVAVGVLPGDLGYALERLEPYGPIILLLLIFVGGGLLFSLISDPMNLLLRLILFS